MTRWGWEFRLRSAIEKGKDKDTVDIVHSFRVYFSFKLFFFIKRRERAYTSIRVYITNCVASHT